MEEQLIFKEASIQEGKPHSSSYDDDEAHMYMEEDIIDSSCSTPFVSAPSSPGRRGQPLTTWSTSTGASGGGGGGFFYSAPASPMHFVLCSADAASSSTSKNSSKEACASSSSNEFEFSARFGMYGTTASGGGSMSSADELFLNGKIRPMKLSYHLQRPQALEPLLDLDELEGDDDDDDDREVIGRRRDVIWRDRSVRGRRTRSMSPLRTAVGEFDWNEYYEEKEKTSEIITSGAAGVVECEAVVVVERKQEEETTPSMSASSSSSSRSSLSSASRGRSKRWGVFLKDFLYRSKSEGGGGRNNNKLWSSITFAAGNRKEKGGPGGDCELTTTTSSSECGGGKKKKKDKKEKEDISVGIPSSKRMNGGKRRMMISPHEVHYKASRAQAEELRKKTFLPYRQGLLGCLGFTSKGYGAINGCFATPLNPTSTT